ncbi:MAG TPA: Stp1/IreP family PP2C-type Ser/Thr phosphatase [Gammaproteobacteria bacterium]|nr:Stp1/IreP family PP2C-type Ser/Thr phosphatase [Gammaproteobacteria bacterium]
MATKLKATIYGQTDVGLAREHNEDSILCDNELGLAVLADGMGGHNAGEVASALAVDYIRNMLRERILGPERNEEDRIDEVVNDVVVHANSEIFTQSVEQVDCHGMGTTLAMALLKDGVLTLAHVGDSRIYRLRDNCLEQVTSDHSLVQELVDNGYLSQDEARMSVSKNLITRALGIGEEVDVDVRDMEPLADDLYLLCSDGLSDLVSEEEIHGILMENRQQLDEIARELISLANRKGGTDNISVILMELNEAFSDDNGITDSVG